MRAYALLVYRAGIGAGSSPGSGSKFVERAMRAIHALVAVVVTQQNQVDEKCVKSLSTFEENNRTENTSSSKAVSKPSAPANVSDQFCIMALCAATITCAEFPPIGNNSHAQIFMESDASEACWSCLLSLLKLSSSHLYSVFLSRIAAFIAAEDATELRRLVIINSSLTDVFDNGRFAVGMDEHLSPPQAATTEDAEKSLKDEAFFNFCRWASPKLQDVQWSNLVKSGLTPDALSTDVMAVVDAMRRCHATDNELDELVKNTLNDASRCEVLFYHQTGVLVFLTNAVDMLLKRSEPRIPIVSPIQLERLTSKITWQQCTRNHNNNSLDLANENNERRCQFVLQVVYAFVFFDKIEDSAFAIDPRSLPLTEALDFCNFCVEGKKERDVFGIRCIHSKLKALTLKHCPEIMEMPLSSTKNPMNYGLIISDEGAITPDRVFITIRECLQGNSRTDPSGCRAERFFFQSRMHFHSAIIDTKAACALLSTRHSPPPFFTYSALCRDPLVLLKCHISVWKCKGLRRIILSILRRALDANEYITYETAPTKEVALEILSVRDTIVARCLLIAGSGSFVIGNGRKEASSPIHCPMTMGFIRSMVARQKGLVAMLLKQGLPEGAVDWLVEFVPESLLDAPLITSCLSERNSLTAAERLTMADAALRIAIVHGSRDESEAQPLTYAALTVLVSSFFLVLGPIGVPVNVICEEGGQDVTQVCRKATFRMLKAMQKIRGSRVSLKNEVNMALSKIAGLCKSEGVMTGVVGIIASKRKSLLKEIWDAVTRANNAMGGTLQI